MTKAYEFEMADGRIVTLREPQGRDLFIVMAAAGPMAKMVANLRLRPDGNGGYIDDEGRPAEPREITDADNEAALRLISRLTEPTLSVQELSEMQIAQLMPLYMATNELTELGPLAKRASGPKPKAPRASTPKSANS